MSAEHERGLIWPFSARRSARERGQTLVEFALVAMIFFTFVMGLVDFGRGVFAYNTLSNAVREGARYGAFVTSNPGRPPTQAEIVAQMNALGFGLGLDTSTVGIGWGLYDPVVPPDVPVGHYNPGADLGWFPRTSGNNSDYYVVVKAQHDFTPITPLIGNLIGGSVTLTATSSMITTY